jgi:hypothetical protein
MMNIKQFSFFFIFISLSSCQSGRSLCCGLQTSEDQISENSIIRDGGIVVFQNVTAIWDVRAGYIVETRQLFEKNNFYYLGECDYYFLKKSNKSLFKKNNIPEIISYQNILKSDFSCK